MSQKKVEFDFQPTAPASKVLGMFVGGITSPPGAIESRFSPLYLAWFEWRDIPSSPLSMDMDGTLRTLASANIIANPNCSTLGTLLPLIFMFVFGLAFDILDSLLWLRTPEKISEGAVGGRVTAPLRGRSVFNFCVTAWDFLKARESCSCDSTWSCRKFSRSLSTVSGYSVDSIARRARRGEVLRYSRSRRCYALSVIIMVINGSRVIGLYNELLWFSRSHAFAAHNWPQIEPNAKCSLPSATFSQPDYSVKKILR